MAEQRRIVGILDEAFEGLATAKANAEQNLQNARALFESHLQAVFTQRGHGWVEKFLADICVVDWGNTDLTKSAYVDGGKFLAVSAAGCDGRIGHKEHASQQGQRHGAQQTFDKGLHHPGEKALLFIPHPRCPVKPPMKTIFRVLPWLRRYPAMAAGQLLCAILGTLLVLVAPTAVKTIIDDDYGLTIDSGRAGSGFGPRNGQRAGLLLGNAQAQSLLGRMRGQSRGHGEMLVMVQTQSRSGLSRTLEWTDIMTLPRRGEPANLSRCEGLNCSQPALSADGARVVFVKADGR